MSEEWMKEDSFLKFEGYSPAEINKGNGRSLKVSQGLDFEVVKFTSKQIAKLLNHQPISSEDSEGEVIVEDLNSVSNSNPTDETFTIPSYDPEDDENVEEIDETDSDSYDDDDDDDDEDEDLW